MSRRWLFATLMSCASVQQAAAQATRISAPERNYLLEITQRWAAESPLGSLPLIPMGDSDVEFRVWGGYGLTGTSGVVLRRIAGRWRGWETSVVQCAIDVASPIADTASAATESLYIARARRRCGTSVGDTRFSFSQYQADTLSLAPLTDTGLEAAWVKAVASGVRELPPRVPRQWVMLDGFTYVIELREGNSYRASVIEAVGKPEGDADRAVKAVYDAVRQAVEGARRRKRR
jgi:hypothetical protein